MSSSGGGGGGGSSTAISLKRTRSISLAAPGPVGVQRHPPPLLRRSNDPKPTRATSSVKFPPARRRRSDGSARIERHEEEEKCDDDDDEEGASDNGGDKSGGSAESATDDPSPTAGATLPGGVVSKRKLKASASRLAKKLRATPSRSAASSVSSLSATTSQSSAISLATPPSASSFGSVPPSAASHPIRLPPPLSASSSSLVSSSSPSSSLVSSLPPASSSSSSSSSTSAPTPSPAPTSRAPSLATSSSSGSSSASPSSFNPLFVPEIRRSVALPRWRLHNALDEMSPTSVQFLESAWQNGDASVTIFDAAGNVYQAKFIRDPASRYQAVSRRVDHKGTEFGEGRPVNRRSDAEIEGPIEFETVCSGGMRAMQKLTGCPYRTMTRREHAAWTTANALHNSLSGGSGGGGSGVGSSTTNFITPGPVDTCAVCAESLGLCTSSSSSSSSSLSSLRSSTLPPSSSTTNASDDDDDESKKDPTTDAESDIVLPLRCHHAIHTACIEQLLAHSNASVNDSCPQCASRFRADGVRVGAQPTGVMRVWCDGATRLPGFPSEPCLVMEADFSPGGGIQGPRHPYPGARYTAHGFPRAFYMPESQRELAFRMQLAFYWRNFFAVAASLSAPAAAPAAASSSSSSGAAETTTQAIVWAGVVSVKNDLGTHGARCFSATDPTANAAYFREVSYQLDRLGITAEFAAVTHKHLALRVPLV